jgi:hypothetical protein
MGKHKNGNVIENHKVVMETWMQKVLELLNDNSKMQTKNQMTHI